MTEPAFVNFLEDGLWQATRAATPERRAYIAKLLKNRLTTERGDAARERRLMMLLGDLDDLELILLQFYNAADTRDEETLAGLRDAAVGPSVHLGSELQEASATSYTVVTRTASRNSGSPSDSEMSARRLRHPMAAGLCLHRTLPEREI